MKLLEQGVPKEEIRAVLEKRMQRGQEAKKEFRPKINPNKRINRKPR